MLMTCRFSMWVILLVVGGAFGAPIDDQRIYFPGENPDGDLVSRNDGLEPEFQQNQIQSAYEAQKFSPPQSPLSAYATLTDHNSDYGRQEQGAVQYQPADWSGIPQYAAAGGEHLQEIRPLGGPSDGSTLVHSSYSQGAASYQPNSQLHQGAVYSGLSNGGAVQGGHKMTKHTWTSQYSTGGTGQLQHGQMQDIPHQQTGHERKTGMDQSPLGHSYSSSVHHTSSQDLASILDGPPQQSHQLHPNIKQAFQNVVKDLNSGVSHNAVHKITKVKKTLVQNVGREPSHIQTTSSNDDINLSQLIEQLQMLEHTPRHVNITWCEEKIKEFLQELRRKQASGVFINQQVQEQTLHQVLTHESVQNPEVSGAAEVHEPLFTKVTVRPLGGEATFHSQSSAQEENGGIDVEVQGPSITPSKEELPKQVQPEIITVIPAEIPRQPESMSHYQSPKEAPPFTSDNHDDLKELELELPEYVPIEHTHSNNVDAFEYNVQKETRPLHQQSSGESEQAHSEISTGLETSHNFPVKASELPVKPSEIQDQVVTQQQSAAGTLTEEEKKLNGLSPPNGPLQQTGKEESHEYVESLHESHHLVHGRPQAVEDELGAALQSSHEEKSMQDNGEQSSYPGESSPDINAEGEHRIVMNASQNIHSTQNLGPSSAKIQQLHNQQINYDTLIEELIQLESIPGHQAIDKCEEKIQEFLEILKYQQEQGFGRNQHELQRLHQTLIEQAQERSKQLSKAGSEESTLPPTSFWRKVQRKIKKTYESAKDRAKEVIG